MCSRISLALSVPCSSAISSSFSNCSSVTLIWRYRSFLPICRYNRNSILCTDIVHRLVASLAEFPKSPPETSPKAAYTNYGAFLMISSKLPAASSFSQARVPRPSQWQQLVQADERLILSPSEFLERWEISKIQLARLCFCSPSTVSRWLTESSCHQDPGDEYMFRLGYVDNLWNIKECKK